MPLITADEVQRLFEPEMRESNAALAPTGLRLAFIGNGQGLSAPESPQSPREVYVRESLSQNDSGIAMLYPGCGIPLNNLDGFYNEEVWVGKVPRSDYWWVLGLADNTGRSAPGGVDPIEALIQLASYPTLDRMAIFAILPGPDGGLTIQINLGWVAGGYNTGGGSTSFARTGVLDLSDPTNAVTYIVPGSALTSGQHRLCAIVRDPSTDMYRAILGTARSTTNTLPSSDSRSEFTDADYQALNLTGTVPCGYVYQYYGQTTYVEDDCMRQFDPRQFLQPLGLDRWGLTSVSSTYTLLSSDNLLAVDTSSPRTINLGQSSTYPIGLPFVIKDATGGAGSNTITVNAYSGETIDGVSSKTITLAYGMLILFSLGGTAWGSLVIGGSGGPVSSVSATYPVVSSGGSTPNISLAVPIQAIAKVDFTYLSSSPQAIRTTVANELVTRVELIIDTAFDGTVSLTVGEAGDVDRFMEAAENLPSEVGVYVSTPEFSDPGTYIIRLYLSIAGSTTGAGRVLVYTKI